MRPFGPSKSKTPKEPGNRKILGSNGILADLIGKASGTEEFPLLPLRELVIFPQTMMSVYVTYKSGINALEESLTRDLRLFAACQKNSGSTDQRSTDQRSEETWDAGTVVRIVQNLRLPDNTFRVVLQGEYRALLVSSRPKNDCSLVKV